MVTKRIRREALFAWFAEVDIMRIDYSKKPPVRTKLRALTAIEGPFWLRSSAEKAASSLAKHQMAYEMKLGIRDGYEED